MFGITKICVINTTVKHNKELSCLRDNGACTEKHLTKQTQVPLFGKKEQVSHLSPFDVKAEHLIIRQVHVSLRGAAHLSSGFHSVPHHCPSLKKVVSIKTQPFIL